MNATSQAHPEPLRKSDPAPSGMLRRVLLAGCTLAGAAAFHGCATEPEPFHPLETTKYTLENTERFAALDRASQHAVSCTGLQHHALADGRLEVIANLKNREARRVEIQASCAFQDEQGLAVLEETPWKNVTIAENTTEAVRFVAANPGSKKYTVRVRQGR